MSLTTKNDHVSVLEKSKIAVIICHTLLFCLELGAQSIDVIWAVFAQQFGLNSSSIGWINFGFYIAVGFGDIIFGTLADKIGFPAVVSITLIMFAVCCLFQGILSNIHIIGIIYIISGFANCAAVLKLGFTTFLLPHKFVVKYQIIAAVCTVFASCFGPLITAIIMIITDDYKYIFYFYAILLSSLFIGSIFSIPNEKKIIQLQKRIEPVPSNENDEESDKEIDVNMNKNRKFQVTKDNEMDFPTNLYHDKKGNKWYKLNLPPLTCWEWMHIMFLISFSFFNWGIIQIFTNWYVFYAKHRYNTSVSTATFQIALSIIFVSLGVGISTKLNKCIKHDQLKNNKIAKIICCINVNDDFLKEIEQNAQIILLWATIVLSFVAYSCIYIVNAYMMWILIPLATCLIGMMHQCLIILYLAVQPPKNVGFILGLKYISRNFGAACCNLFVGYMINYNLNWFWISFALCVSIEFLIVVCMWLSTAIRRRNDEK